MLSKETFEILDKLAFLIVGHLRKLTGYVYNPNEEFFQYQLTLRVPSAAGDITTDVTAGTAQAGSIDIEQGSDFVATNMSAAIEVLSALTLTNSGEGAAVASISPTAATPVGPTLAPPPIDYMISGGGSDRQMSNEQINGYAGIGIGMFPRTFPKPRLFKGNSSIRLNIRPRFGITAGAYNIFFVFTGYKKFHLGAQNLTSRK